MSDFLHNHPEFPELIRIVARDKGIDPSLVEKDYWIMHSLYGLQQLSMKFELKGGTSLSKGFQIIDRFSEDIDIRIEPPPGQDVKIGPNQRKRNTSKAAEHSMVGLQKKFRSMGLRKSNATPHSTTII